MTTPHSAAPERSVVDRTLSILGAFDRDNRTLTLSDISRRACLPVATVHRIVTKLHGWGALERSPEGGYSIGLRLWETAILAPRSAVVEAAQPHLVTLHAQTQAAAMIAIRDGKECVSLSFVSDDPILTALCGNPGTRIPLHATATGLVLLAHAGSAVQNEVCSGPLRAYTPATLTNRSHLKQCLAKVRREGYAVARGTFAPDCACFAVPVRDSRGVVVAAVGVVGSFDTFQPRRVAPHVRAAAALIQRHVRSEGLRVTEVGA
jgi:DNA-binding IclR family transcriptional regulator